MLGICVCLCAILSPVLTDPQDAEEPVIYSCTDGYQYDPIREQCKDIDECALVEDACKGGMMCINHFGGYLCLPHNSQIYVSNSQDQGAQTDTVRPVVPPAVVPRPGIVSPGGAGVVAGTGAGAGAGGGVYPGPRAVSCSLGFAVDEQNVCRDVNECELQSPCQHQCYNLLGSFLCQCHQGYELAGDTVSCQDIDECSFSSYMCQYQCINTQGSYTCQCPDGYQLHGARLCQDINECEKGTHDCREDEMCWNYYGSFRCYPSNPCLEPYVRTGENRCSCRSQTDCQGVTPSIIYKYMSIQSERPVPSDIFQIQATNMYANTHNTFRIKSGNEAGEFFLRRSSNMSAMLVMTKPLSGPSEHVVDLEMITQHMTMNYRSSSLLRLTVIVGPYAF
ncbi:EGF-containing fibulin-like extracellular matrix protein 1 isoform X3 [Gadus morhua]|uniref:EGF-containing fibulin-like extracellular matrix protein 1 isoform X3 n=1 Tax=Gadus morhua TaxID=8049 RepID=UPI0011B699F5|nr:EGF-containing fibulin-like extracellular matrix protein 1 isoform X3 [Gadus morhua]